MQWMEEVQKRLDRKNQILFSQENPLFEELSLLIQQSTHRAAVLWAFEFTEQIVQTLQSRYPQDGRPANTLALSRDWAAGRIKMPVAKQAILQVHVMAKELSSPADAARCHAIGQACGVVHTKGHALGLPIYELTAIVREQGMEHCQDAVQARNQQYVQRMRYWQQNYQEYSGSWAAFLLAD
ncbi:hypothetical protein LJC55_02345 [Eubacteriales bacterium OttesenSCG-928-N14]|nr:hypothetical protein [Eubacteriales bacterium OttesenSCG-928-N14]